MGELAARGAGALLSRGQPPQAWPDPPGPSQSAGAHSPFTGVPTGHALSLGPVARRYSRRLSLQPWVSSPPPRPCWPLCLTGARGGLCRSSAQAASPLMGHECPATQHPGSLYLSEVTSPLDCTSSVAPPTAWARNWGHLRPSALPCPNPFLDVTDSNPGLRVCTQVLEHVGHFKSP